MPRIVVGLDGSAHADRALHWAIEEAEVHGAEIELVLGYVTHMHYGPLAASSRDVAEQTMAAAVERNAGALDRVEWTSTLAPLLKASYADAVLDAGEDAGLVVVGSRGLGGFRKLLLGSTSYKVVAHAPAPVAVVRGDADRDLDRAIIVGIDGSRASLRALRWAVAEAAARETDVTVVHGYFGPNAVLLSGVASSDQIDAEKTRARELAERVIDKVLDGVDVPSGVAVTRQIVAGTSAAAILRVATAEHLIVVGTRGYGGVRRAIVGSTSHQVLHHAEGPVVVVP